MLHITELRVVRGGMRVLDGVSLTVAAGERVSLHGPSGCGKSTLLHAIAGLTEVERGAIVVNGRDITHEPPHLRGIGLVFQDDRLFPHFNVGDNVSYSLRVRGVDKQQRHAVAAAWLERVGLTGFARRQVDSLSGGESKRVAMARTLAAEPSIVLLDEPLSGLDDALHATLLADLRELFVAMGTSVLHVTHDRAEGALLCDRAVEFTRLVQQ